MKLVDKEYKRSRDLYALTSQAAARIERRDGMRIRRRPVQAAVIRAERIISWTQQDAGR